MHRHSFVELHFTANNIKILNVAQEWRIYVADYNETYLGWVFMYWGPVLSKFTFLNRFSWKFLIPNFTEIRSVGSTLIHEDRQTDATKLVGAASLYDVTQVPEYHSMNNYL